MTYKTVFLVGIICGLFAVSCSPKLPQDKLVSGNNRIVYPHESDTLYFQYLKGITANTDIEQISKFQESITGKTTPKWVSKPYGIDVHKGIVYVADIAKNSIAKIDVGNKVFEEIIHRNKDLQFFLTLTHDENGDRYIVDAKNPRVFIFNADGKLKDNFKLNEPTRPVRIRVKKDKIYIADIPTGKIYIYDKETFKLVKTIHKEGVTQDDDEFIYMAMDFDVDDTYIYVLDAGHFKVKIYTLDGKFVKSFGDQGMGYGVFIRPKSIAVDKEGNIHVADSGTNSIQVLNFDGQPLIAYAYSYKTEEDKDTNAIDIPTQMVIDYNNLDIYKGMVDPKYNLKYLIYVANQKGDGLIKVYGRIELKK